MNALEFFLNNYWAAIILMLVTIIIAGIASMNVKSTFAKYDRIKSEQGVPAHIIARQILDANGLYDVIVEPVRGHLTDHYHPKRKVVALSEATYNSTSVSAIGIAAHECGHAVQHARHYVPVKIRSALVPVLSIANYTWLGLVLVGAFISMANLISVGVIVFGLSAVFQLVTLPVEFDASKRAMDTISAQGILSPSEQVGARKTLSAAAMTYVAALMVAIAQLIRILALSRRRR